MMASLSASREADVGAGSALRLRAGESGGGCHCCATLPRPPRQLAGSGGGQGGREGREGRGGDILDTGQASNTNSSTRQQSQFPSVHNQCSQTFRHAQLTCLTT